MREVDGTKLPADLRTALLTRLNKIDWAAIRKRKYPKRNTEIRELARKISPKNSFVLGQTLLPYPTISHKKSLSQRKIYKSGNSHVQE